jgi:hypothetical protein
MVHGSFEEVTYEDDRDRAFAVMAAQGDLQAPDSIAPYVDGPDALVVYRIRITELQGRFERNEPLVLRRTLHPTA